MNTLCEEAEQISGLTENEKEIVMNIVHIFDGITAPVVITLGLIGNFFTTVVMTRRPMHTSTHFFLNSLALWDSAVLLSSLCIIALPKISKWYELNTYRYAVPYIYPLAFVSQTSTIWITVSFTVERYIAVCHPLRAASLCTLRRARIIVLVISASSLLFNINRWFEYEVTFSNNTSEVLFCQQTEFGKNKQYKMVYYSILYPCVMLVIPLSILTILNSLLVIAVKKSQRQQMSMNVRQSHENNITIMVVWVVAVFMICQVPALVYNVAYSLHTGNRKQFGWEVLSPLRNFLVTFNSAINFLLYCSLGKTFRCVLFYTFCRCLRMRFSSYHGATQTIIPDCNMANTNNAQKHVYRHSLYEVHSHSPGLEMQISD